jgi:5-oxoprolinase (ATP-hydrolysing)
MKLYGDDLKEGDVLMTNSPHAGGSQVLLIISSLCLLQLSCRRHLPDITIISPVFHPESKEIIFFTASRGHHADIGGILPGSMPPTSVNIFEEGAEIVSFKLVKEGVFDQKGLYEYMIDKPAKYPGSSGCRNIRDVESDLKAVSFKGVIHTFCIPEKWIYSSKLLPTTKAFN